MANPNANPGYNKDGRFVGTKDGAYDHKGRKIGYDEDDMKVGLSDTARFLDDPRHMANEDAYIKLHPIGKPKNANGFQPFPHPGGIHEHLANEHGGHRTESDVRYDIRHGYNIAKQRGQSQSLLSAEDMGYAARKHIYIQREEDAKKKKEAPVNTAGRSQQFTFTDETPSAPARIASKPKPSSKPKPYRDPNDTFGAAVKHVVNKFRGK
jgi:hypothetical protein